MSVPGEDRVTLTNVTLTANEASGNSIDGLFSEGGVATAVNMIIANGDGSANCNVIAGANAALTSLGNNIDNGTTCALDATGDLSNTDPELGPLQNNGGPTLTRALQAGSPAIDAGNSEQEVCPTTDQRGTERPQGAACDIGAFERVDTTGGDVAPEALTIDGPTEGEVDVTYSFTASVVPTDTTTPVTYTWTVEDQDDIIVSAGISNTQEYSWNDTGNKNIFVVADNGIGEPVSNTLIIDIDPAGTVPVSITAVNLTGPATGEAGQRLTFRATVEPNNATTPVTYTWVVDEQEPITVNASNSRNNQQRYTWTLTGTKTLTVTADNGLGEPVTDTLTIDITPQQVDPVELEQVTIDGPPVGEIEAEYSFTAAVEPENATTPVTYVWEADEQETITSTADLSNSQRYTWSLTGTKTLTVTASNGVGAAVTDTFQIDIRTFQRTTTITPGQAADFRPAGDVDINFPAGSFEVTATITYTPSITVTPPEDTVVVRQFTLLGTNEQGEPITQTSTPYTITLSYTAAELEALGLVPEDLQLFAWDGEQWIEVPITAATTLASIQTVNLTQFVLIGPAQAEFRVYLPRVVRITGL
ncbi:MAG: hypothetical protein HC893_01395 [Chloroflexaceae bacterium]|nr:hypothetical protein [Chloroflexaceae bacterium]